MQNEEAPLSLHAPLLTALNLPWRSALSLGIRCLAPIGAQIQSPPAVLQFFYLARGRITIMHVDLEGRERAIFSLGPGNIFNEAPAAAGFDAPNSAFICADKCEFYKFPADLLHDSAFVASNPHLIINLMSSLGVKLLIMHTSLSNMTGASAVGRLSRFLSALATRRNQTKFDPGMTQESLSILLGMNRATLVRALHELKECGAIIRFTKRSLEIGDMDKLRQLADF